MDNRDVAAHLNKTIPIQLRDKVLVEAKLTGEIVVTARSSARNLVGFAHLTSLDWSHVKPDSRIILRMVMVAADNYDTETSCAARFFQTFSHVEFDTCRVIHRGKVIESFTDEDVVAWINREA